MTYRFDDFEIFGKEQLETVATSSSFLAKSWQTTVAESIEYSKMSFQSGSAALEKLLGAKSLETSIQIQCEYVKTSYDGLVGYVTKIAEVYTNLGKDAFKPIGTAITKVQGLRE